MLDEKRLTTDGFEGTHRAINAPREIALGFFKQLL